MSVVWEMQFLTFYTKDKIEFLQCILTYNLLYRKHLNGVVYICGKLVTFLFYSSVCLNEITRNLSTFSYQ